MEGGWHPDAAGLAQIVQLLKESQCNETRIQQTVQQVLPAYTVPYNLSSLPLSLPFLLHASAPT